ncbi:MAG: EthD family reductase [Blastocatellia bacterium]
MIRVTALYPQTEGSHFDMEYYLGKHMPMVAARLAAHGMVRGEVDAGLAGLAPGAPAPYVAVGYLIFETLEGFQQGLAAHGPEILGDIPNYTNIEPILQISRIALDGK